MGRGAVQARAWLGAVAAARPAASGSRPWTAHPELPSSDHCGAGDWKRHPKLPGRRAGTLLLAWLLALACSALGCDASQSPLQSTSHSPFVAVHIGEAARPGPVSLDGATFCDAHWVQRMPQPPPQIVSSQHCGGDVGNHDACPTFAFDSFGSCAGWPLAVPPLAHAVAAPAHGDYCSACGTDLLAHGTFWTICACHAHVCTTCATDALCPCCAARIPVHPSFHPVHPTRHPTWSNDRAGSDAMSDPVVADPCEAA